MLITSEIQVRAHLTSLRKDYDFDTLRPFLKQAEEGILVDLLGQTTYSALLETTLTEVQQKLREMAEVVVVWHGYLSAFVSLTYNVSNSGVNRSTPKDTEILRRWEIDAILGDAAVKADQAIERMMAYLEAQAADFGSWTSSPEYLANYAFFIPNAQILGEALPEAKSTYRLFLVLKNYFNRVERQTVKVLMGPLYEGFKMKFRNLTALSDAEKEALLYAREYVAAQTMVDALPFLRVQFAADGVRLVQTIYNIHDEIPVNMADLEALRNELRGRANQARDDLRGYLNQNASATVFPSYFSSSNYSAPNSRTWKTPDNSGKRSFRL